MTRHPPPSPMLFIPQLSLLEKTYTPTKPDTPTKPAPPAKTSVKPPRPTRPLPPWDQDQSKVAWTSQVQPPQTRTLYKLPKAAGSAPLLGQISSSEDGSSCENDPPGVNENETSTVKERVKSRFLKGIFHTRKDSKDMKDKDPNDLKPPKEKNEKPKKEKVEKPKKEKAAKSLKVSGSVNGNSGLAVQAPNVLRKPYKSKTDTASIVSSLASEPASASYTHRPNHISTVGKTSEVPDNGSFVSSVSMAPSTVSTPIPPTAFTNPFSTSTNVQAPLPQKQVLSELDTVYFVLNSEWDVDDPQDPRDFDPVFVSHDLYGGSEGTPSSRRCYNGSTEDLSLVMHPKPKLGRADLKLPKPPPSIPLPAIPRPPRRRAHTHNGILDVRALPLKSINECTDTESRAMESQ